MWPFGPRLPNPGDALVTTRSGNTVVFAQRAATDQEEPKIFQEAMKRAALKSWETQSAARRTSI